jgi:PKD repeat protein
MLIVLIGCAGLVMPVYAIPLTLINNVSPFESPFGMISINATVADYSVTELPVYQGTIITNGSVDLHLKSSGDIRWNVTPEEDAPEVARQILESYGGLPPDAEFNGASTFYSRKYNLSRNEIISKKPMFTSVTYSQANVNGLWIVGDKNYLILDLGDNGEPLWIYKIWRNYTYSGEARIIPVNAAFEKLGRGELLNSPMIDQEKITIDIASPGYYAKKLPNNDANLEPVWLLFGDTESGSRIGFYIYARQFANFTATPAEVTMFKPVQFMDTSETAPTKWYWEFGDGTNSTEQNPSHLYKTGGNYAVNLTVWNDMGRDTISLEDYVHVYYTSPAPVADFTSNYTRENETVLVVSPVTIQFIDQSLVSGNNTQWFWDFGDETNSTEQNPVHIFTYQEPDDCSFYDCLYTLYTITLTVTDNYGRTSTYFEYFGIPRDTHIDFIGEPTSGASPLTVNFSEMPDEIRDDMVILRSWDFGDGSNYTWDYWLDGEPPITNISHVYSSLGNYTVTFSKEINDAGGIFQKNKEHYIVVIEYSNLPVADFMANVTSGRSPLGVVFSDQSLNSPTNWNWSFGDGTNSTEQNPIHVYSAAGKYTVSLTAANTYGENTTTKVDYISVYEPIPPVADFMANVTSGYEPLAVAFNDTSANAPEQWNWSFGDGTTSMEKDPVHVYYVSGKYSVSLQVTNEYGSDTKVRTDYITVIRAFPTQTIVVPPPTAPVADFTGTPVSGKEPLMVIFNDNSANFPSTWLWDFGDGINATNENPIHIYTAVGNYTVSLTATNAEGANTTIKIDYITVVPLAVPDANFTAVLRAGKAPLTVVFNDTSTESPTIWSWDLGDRTISAEQHPVHEYGAAGTYTISLTAANDDGSDTETKPDYITVTSLMLPVADFTANTTSGNVPLAVAFTDTSSGSPTSWNWTFGDGAVSSEQNPVHVYTNTGTYTVSLEVTNPDGSNTTTKTEYITVAENILPPVANFTGKPTCGKAPLTVRFNDTSTGSPTSWFWDFGDGTNATGQNPTHTYMQAGKYTVSLTATNAGGSNTSTKKDYITVSGSVKPPVANFYAKPTSGKAPLSVKFTDASYGFPTSWYWDFGDGSNSTERNPVYVYTIPGKYTISLTVTNAGGSDTKTKYEYITVKGITPPVANFYGKPTYGKAPLSVTFTDTSTGSPTGWYWTFGDGTNSTEQNPVHTYTAAGRYTVTLTASNASGNTTKTKIQYITVSGPTPTTSPTCTHS